MLQGMIYRLQIYPIWNISSCDGPWAEDWCPEVGPSDSASNRKGESCKVAWLTSPTQMLRSKLAPVHIVYLG